MTQQSSGSRRRLQWTLGGARGDTVASAIGEIVRGPQGVPGGSPDVIPTVDSSLRYANVFKFAVGPVIWSQLGRVEQSPAVTFAAVDHLRRRPGAAAVMATARATASHHGGGDRARDHRSSRSSRLAAAPLFEGGSEQMPSVLVTGAGRGIGLAITEHMSRRGWDVYATARSDAALNSLDRLPNVHAIALDITDRAAIAKLSDQLPADAERRRQQCRHHRERTSRGSVPR